MLRETLQARCFARSPGTLGFWMQSEQLQESWLENLIRSFYCYVSFYIFLWSHWSWDQLHLGQVLYKCRQQVIKSFYFYLGNIKAFGSWWVSLESVVPPSLFLMQLNYNYDFKDPSLQGLGCEQLLCKVTEITEVQTEKWGQKQDWNVPHCQASRPPQRVGYWPGWAVVRAGVTSLTLY